MAEESLKRVTTLEDLVATILKVTVLIVATLVILTMFDLLPGHRRAGPDRRGAHAGRPEHRPRLPDGHPDRPRGTVLQGRLGPDRRRRGRGRGGRDAPDGHPRRHRHGPQRLERGDADRLQSHPHLRADAGRRHDRLRHRHRPRDGDRQRRRRRDATPTRPGALACSRRRTCFACRRARRAGDDAPGGRPRPRLGPVRRSGRAPQAPPRRLPGARDRDRRAWPDGADTGRRSAAAAAAADPRRRRHATAPAMPRPVRGASKGASPRCPSSPGSSGDRLEAHGDYVAIDFVELDLAGQDASDTRFLECRLDPLQARWRLVPPSADPRVGHRRRRRREHRSRRLDLAGQPHLGRAPRCRLADRRDLDGCPRPWLPPRVPQPRGFAPRGCPLRGRARSGASTSGRPTWPPSPSSTARSTSSTCRAPRSARWICRVRGCARSSGSRASRARWSATQQLVDLAPILAEQLGLEVRSDDPTAPEA